MGKELLKVKRFNVALAIAAASMGQAAAQRIQEPPFLTTQSPYANFGREKQQWQGQGKRKKPKQK